jgi:hypothetical protein
MGRAELGFYRGVTTLCIWATWLSALPLVFLGGLLIGEVFYWLAQAHWMRVTLCTLGNYASAPNIPGVNQFVQHELDRCDVNSGARGLDIILNYALNDLSVFMSLTALSFAGIFVFVYLAESAGRAADDIERRLERKPS